MLEALEKASKQGSEVTGDFVTIDGERCYMIRNIDQMKSFFISVVSSSNHWLFASSTGGLTAGRVSPDTALFPYVTVDKIHESTPHTGCLTIIRETDSNTSNVWEPFNRQQFGRYEISRNLYKNLLGNKLCFEEINHDLQLAFRYTWSTSNEYGFVRRCTLENRDQRTRVLEVLDGLQNVLPAGTPPHTQSSASNLVDAYKWTELDATSGLAMFTLYSGISDRAEPCESLRANTIFSLGLEQPTMMLSNAQINRFRNGHVVEAENMRRGARGAYLAAARIEVSARGECQWTQVADIEKSQSDVIALQAELSDPASLLENLEHSISAGSDALAAIIASADGYQAVAEESVSTHHYANVLFNVLRGGIFDRNYDISAEDFRNSVAHFNSTIFERNQDWLETLPETITRRELLTAVQAREDLQLERLCLEYLPIRFGRRHGDPSRPWNHYAIRLADEVGGRLLAYEGNWRDIFQNWEALLLSFPEFTESVIAKFVNASTADGYNPYRITQEGIDWEVEDKDDPWSYIGYWGDHQIIYLQKLLELSQQFHPEMLGDLLHRRVFSYANVPYRIRDFAAIWANPKVTVDYDAGLAAQIEAAEASLGADAKLLRSDDGSVYQVSLFEKLLVALLAKLGNTVIDGGIWLNTQRPEWNDANNALVGQGLSMVTLYYLRRYISFLRDLASANTATVELSSEVANWLAKTANCLASQKSLASNGELSAEDRFAAIKALAEAASDYRQTVYANGFTERQQVAHDDIRVMFDDAIAIIDRSIVENRRDDGLYHAYNLLAAAPERLEIESLYPMLEGQVAALSSGALSPADAVAVVEALFDSEIYRADQHSFMLYPDRSLPSFLQKNLVPEESAKAIPLVDAMLAQNDQRVICTDPTGQLRFHADFVNVDALLACLDTLHDEYGDLVTDSRAELLQLYEDVFDHRSFTGRSGGMFGFEGLGCIYWHMVSKLLLAVQENFVNAIATGAPDADRLGALYYKVRDGIGFNKTPEEYGAFPTDPYSHTPGHSGARQPGMTGMVKEEILTRFGELGVRVLDGFVRFQPNLLRRREFLTSARTFCYLDVFQQWQDIDVPASSLAFSWCQVPIVYVLDSSNNARVVIERLDSTRETRDGMELGRNDLSALTARSGEIRQLTIHIPDKMLLSD